ncbi:DUF998 domain-containing protein [Glaciihabitans arcticus]|nr:DUF998 domain-containing protein [Glaciihabitans arcticus]
MTGMEGPRAGNRNIESYALIAGAGGAVVGYVSGFIAFSGQLTGLGGSGSISGLAAAVSAIVGAIAFVLGYIRQSADEIRWRRRSLYRRVIDVLGLTLTGVGVAVLMIGSIFQVLQLAFRDLVLNSLTSSTLVAVTAGVTAYALFLIASQISTKTLASLLALFLVAGVFASMLTADDATWWQRNFSALGMGGNGSAQAFNLTIIVAGFAMITLADYLTMDLRSRPGPRGMRLRGVSVIRILLIIIGIALTGVGLVPVDVSVLAHNTFSSTALVGFAVLLVLVPTLLKGLPKGFVITTFVVIGVIVVGGVLFLIGYYNLTALELVAVLVIFAWLILFARNATGGQGDAWAPEPAAAQRVQRRRIGGVLVGALAVGAFLAGRLTRR